MAGVLRFPLSNIPSQGLDLDLEIEREELDLGEGEWPPMKEIRLRGRLEQTGAQEVAFRGSVSGLLTLECSLGLAKYAHRFEEPFSVYFLLPEEGGEGAEEAVELGEKDLEVARIEGEAVDLSEPVRDQIGLVIPIQPRCPGECLGEDPELCRKLEAGEPVGMEAGSDPKWAVLKEWKK